ncbi:MAG: hypothetical protein GBAus27B_000521 [Mycoplasmataceae bacterium]|nr:MAG: hypothetical protein GBAus27B_000521 [Mycoplasmataceae bacterium]
MGGNQVIKFTPTTELIFPSRVPIFDENGDEIVGEENIRTEIERRKEQWAEWERTGQLQESVEIHHTDDGKTIRIKFRAAPKKNHRNETNSFFGKLGELWNGEPNSKKHKAEDENLLLNDRDSDITDMDLSKNNKNNSAKKIVLLSDDEIKNASKEQLIDSINKIKAELAIMVYFPKIWRVIYKNANLVWIRFKLPIIPMILILVVVNFQLVVL